MMPTPPESESDSRPPPLLWPRELRPYFSDRETLPPKFRHPPRQSSRPPAAGARGNSRMRQAPDAFVRPEMPGWHEDLAENLEEFSFKEHHQVGGNRNDNLDPRVRGTPPVPRGRPAQPREPPRGRRPSNASYEDGANETRGRAPSRSQSRRPPGPCPAPTGPLTPHPRFAQP